MDISRRNVYFLFDKVTKMCIIYEKNGENMKNIRINKKIISTLFAGVVLLSLSGCNKKTHEINQENKIGHIDIQKPKDIPSTDFIYYNVGNHNKIGISRQEELLAKCKEKNISRGIIINSDASTMLEIYEDIEYTKSVIEKNDIDLPVYFDIDNIIENDNLSMSEKAALILEYITIIKKNNIYVGLYGSSTNLSILNQYGIQISATIDCFIKKDGITDYNGNSSITQDIDGNIISTCDDITKNLNKKETLKQNGYCIIDENTDLNEISMKYDISINDLLKYNNIEKKDIKDKTILRIPNEIQEKTQYIYEKLERKEQVLYKGIDISYCQQLKNNVDFKRISERIDFAILKIGEQDNKEYNELREDPKFKEFYEQCNENNISVGGYYVTNATTINEAIKEAELIVKRLKNLNITFPIFIDYENTTGTEYEKQFNQIKESNSMSEILKAASSIFEREGLRFGIYANLSTYTEIKKIVPLNELSKYEIWLSYPNDNYTTTTQVIDNGPICKTRDEKYIYGCDINQVSWKISDLGIGNSEGNVDYNYCYKDYKTPQKCIELPPEYIFETKEYKRKDPKGKMKFICRFTGITTGFLFTVYVIGHRKKIKKHIKKICKKIP